MFLGIRRQRKTERAGCRVRAEKTSRLLDRRSFQVIRDFLMEYCDKPFVSGFEQMTPRLLPGYFAPYSDTYENDRRGSYIFCSKGSTSRSIMLEAHVDELGFMITELLPGGFLRFSPVGYYNTLCLEAQDIIIYGKKEVAGVICARPDKPQPEKEIINLRTDWLYIDTGLSGGELEALVQPGDVALLRRKPVILDGDIICARGLDDKAGVAVMLAAARELEHLPHTSTIYYSAAVQEEGPGLGGQIATYQIHPDIAFAFDVGHGWTEDLPRDEMLRVGGGPALAIGGRFHPGMVRKFIAVCEKFGIPYQLEPTPAASGTDAESIQTNRDGVPVLLISIPLRYMHTGVETGSVSDIENIGKAVAHMISEIDRENWEGLLCY